MSGNQIATSFIFVYRITTYNIVPANKAATSQIEYFSTDKAQLVAPIRSVKVTRTDQSGETFIIQNGVAALPEYFDPLNPIDNVTAADY